jgi:hypothetical protein
LNLLARKRDHANDRSGKASKLVIEAERPEFSSADSSQDATYGLKVGSGEFGEDRGRHALLQKGFKDEALAEVVVFRPISLRIVAVQHDGLA